MSEEQKRNRKKNREIARRLKCEDPGLDIVHRNAAGIDVGNASHYVAIAPNRDDEPVREFGCCTEELRRLAGWLKSRGIETVAMQSTGVYWMPVYDILEENGIEVFLVNATHTKNLPGRKSDVQESQWLLKLHTYGLLRNSFRPAAEILALRTYWRLRGEHVTAAGSAVQRMQKVLTQMNVQLANVISDISGTSGMAIIRAILSGERDREQLASLCDARIRASAEEVAKSLEGHWREDLLFALQQEVDNYDHCQRQIAGCDSKLRTYLESFQTRENANPKAAGAPSEAKRRARGKENKYKKRGNAPAWDLRSELKRISGVDLTLIDGVDVMTAQTVISEIGWDVSRWKTEGHFASWLGLCPNHEITGGKVLKRGTRRVVHPIAEALRMAASTLLKSQCYLGAQYRRLRTRRGAPKAITAMAHKLARIIYRMLKYGEGYVDKGKDFYEEKFREQQIRLLEKKAATFGLQLKPAPATV